MYIYIYISQAAPLTLVDVTPIENTKLLDWFYVFLLFFVFFVFFLMFFGFMFF